MRAVFFWGLLLACTGVQARDFHIDPLGGAPGGDGSAARPWRTLQEVIEAHLIETQHWARLPYEAGAALQVVNPGAPVRAGDTLILHTGYHGDILIQGAYNAQTITVEAATNETPRLGSLHVRGGSHWTFRGLSISPSYAGAYARQTLAFFERHAHHGPTEDISLEDCELFSVADAQGWTAQQWIDLACDGVIADGDRITIDDNLFRNVRFAIESRGSYAVVSGNTIENFSGDGIRGLGDDSVYEYNLVKNSYAVDANHDDGFQSYSRGPEGQGTTEVRRVTVRNNVFINYENPNQRHRGEMQGIGCFDGFFVDWVVENNLVITNHWHGITLLGARDSLIINNTVYDPNPEEPGPSWIQIDAHKTRGPSANVIVRNNLAPTFQFGAGVIDDHNLEVGVADAARFYVNAAGLDFHLRAGSPAIDQGNEIAPMVDLEGIMRPQGNGVDVGAYEWVSPAVDPPDQGIEQDAAPVPLDGSMAIVDAAVPSPDASVMTPDGMLPLTDRGVAQDRGRPQRLDMWRLPPVSLDAAVPEADGDTSGGVESADEGCHCNSAESGPNGLGLLLLLFLGVRRLSHRKSRT